MDKTAFLGQLFTLQITWYPLYWDTNLTPSNLWSLFYNSRWLLRKERKKEGNKKKWAAYSDCWNSKQVVFWRQGLSIGKKLILMEKILHCFRKWSRACASLLWSRKPWCFIYLSLLIVILKYTLICFFERLSRIHTRTRAHTHAHARAHTHWGIFRILLCSTIEHNSHGQTRMNPGARNSTCDAPVGGRNSSAWGIICFFLVY